MAENKYRGLVSEMGGGVGWRDLREDDLERDPARDVEITDIDCMVVEGNFPWNLIVVKTDAGECGIGEAFTGPAGEYVEFLKPGVVGQNPFDTDRLVEHMTQLVSGLGGTAGYSQAAVSGIETALLDVVGKLTGLPIYQLLGGKYRDEVEIYADCHAGESLSDMHEGDIKEMYAPESYAAVASEAVEEGFSSLKFDLDVETETADTATRRLSQRAIEHKIDVVQAVCAAVGPDVDVGFDLHWNYELETATQIAHGIEEFDVAWLEDPVPPESADTHRELTTRTSTPVLAGENVVRMEGFVPFLTEHAVDIVAPDLQKCGGLREFQKIAALADATSTPLAPHNISSPVGTLASVHACASVPNAFVLEYHAREVEFWEEMHTGDELIDDGAIGVPEAPGLGIDLNLDVVAEHLAPGEELVELDA